MWKILIMIKKKNRVEKIAKAKGISMAQLSLAWIMSQEGMFSSTVGGISLLVFLKLTDKNFPKAYRHPLLELPPLTTYMISLVWFYLNSSF